MLKTVKVKKQFRLDELIKYIFDNKIKDKRFGDSEGVNVVVSDSSGYISFINRVCTTDMIDRKKIFEIEVEEPITEDTEFEAFVIITDKGILKSINNYHNMRAVRGLLENYEVEQKIYALIDNNLQLIWEAE